MATLKGWKLKLIGKMRAEEIKDFSDDEIRRVFSDCVAKNSCINYAKDLIAAGDITLEDVCLEDDCTQEQSDAEMFQDIA